MNKEIKVLNINFKNLQFADDILLTMDENAEQPKWLINSLRTRLLIAVTFFSYLF